MRYAFSLKIRLFFVDEKKAQAAFLAVSAETGQKHEKRSKTLMNINKNVVLLKIIALDAPALKASVNSYLKLLLLSEKLSEDI